MIIKIESSVTLKQNYSIFCREIFFFPQNNCCCTTRPWKKLNVWLSETKQIQIPIYSSKSLSPVCLRVQWFIVYWKLYNQNQTQVDLREQRSCVSWWHEMSTSPTKSGQPQFTSVLQGILAVPYERAEDIQTSVCVWKWP